MEREFLLFDAKDKILGRFCSQIAKKALLGYNIVIINAKDALISGNKRDIKEKYLGRLNVKTSTNPRKGPFWKRRPDSLMKSIIRKMLPRKKLRGKKALKRVHVFISDIPDRFKKKYPNLQEQSLPNADKNRLRYFNKITTLETLCTRMGWKKGVEV
ncbi:MAG: 50S ribosomal protein L13 [Promethearchaeia archaeon]